jgi:quinol monooxygenase YgiN
MSAPVLAGYVGVLVAAVATGMLAGRYVRQPRIGFIVWTGAILGLAVALGAQSLGFARGFDQVTFRTVQLTALLLVPLWLAWGLVEVAVGNGAFRFGTRLISAALAVVASVILVTDPLSGQPFSRTWPLTGVHFQPIARLALDVVQVAAVLVALVCVGLVLAGRGLRPPRTAVLPPGLAVLMTAGLRFPLPAKAAYPLLSTAAAGLVLVGASRAGAGRRQAGERDGRLDGVHDDGGRYRPQDSFRDQRTGYPGPGRPGDLPGSRPGSGGDRGGQAAAPARPYGRIQIFTVLDDRVADFDRLAEEAAEQVSTGEPDTLVYVIHLVPNAPMQRIFYEIYRDRAAFDSHESQPYMQRFAAERRSLVLATNVIELRLKYAKVAPLLNPQSAMPAGAQAPPPLSPQPQPQWSQPPPAPAGRGPQRPPGPAGDPRLQPPPPPRPQRPGQPRPGQVPRPDQPRPERYEPRRPDQRPDPRADPRPDPRADPRQVPSAERRHGG